MLTTTFPESNLSPKEATPVSAIDEPRALAATLIESLNGQQDAQTLAAVWELFSKTTDTRSLILQDTQKILSGKSLKAQTRVPALTRQAHEAQIQAHDPQRELQKAKFMSNVERLETEESELKSCIQESHASIQSLSLEIESLQRELAILEREETIESEAPPNQEIVKLSIYRSLGIDLLENATGDAFTQCQIRSSPKNDIHTLEFDPKFSRFFYANLLWDMCT